MGIDIGGDLAQAPTKSKVCLANKPWCLLGSSIVFHFEIVAPSSRKHKYQYLKTVELTVERPPNWERVEGADPRREGLAE